MLLVDISKMEIFVLQWSISDIMYHWNILGWIFSWYYKNKSKFFLKLCFSAYSIQAKHVSISQGQIGRCHEVCLSKKTTTRYHVMYVWWKFICIKWFWTTIFHGGLPILFTQSVRPTRQVRSNMQIENERIKNFLHLASLR